MSERVWRRGRWLEERGGMHEAEVWLAKARGWDISECGSERLRRPNGHSIAREDCQCGQLEAAVNETDRAYLWRW